MKVLIVCSGNANYTSPFVLDQTNALKKKSVQIEFFLIKGKGLSGYIKNYKLLLNKIKEISPDLIHAHYGLSGLLCVLQRKVPVVTTFHGSDVNVRKNRLFSKIADLFSAKTIFVTKDLANKLNKRNSIIIPCGVDLDVFYPISKREARGKMNLLEDKRYVLFSSFFDNSVKNYPLAKAAVEKINNLDIELIELKEYNREEVALLMNAVDLVLLTSFTEGSPQFIKEAMACNCPIVSTDVGDVKKVVENTKGCFIGEYDAQDIKNKIVLALNFNKKTTGRNDINYFDNQIIATKIINIYQSVLN